MRRGPFYSIPRNHDKGTVFILCGGPSATQANIDLLQSAKAPVIAVNSMYRLAPFAPYAFFCDWRWWNLEKQKHPEEFKNYRGIMLTTQTLITGRRVEVLKIQCPPPHLSAVPHAVAMTRTATAGALNIAYWLGAKKIILVGVDNCPDPVTARVHTHEEYPRYWKILEDHWSSKYKELHGVYKALRSKKVKVLTCSPWDALDFIPKCTLEEVIRDPLIN